MARATKRQAQTALRAIRKRYGFGPADEGGPRLVEEYHGWYSSYPNAIVWEEGPFEWAVLATIGGFDEELFHGLYPEFEPDREKAAARCRQEPVKWPKGTYAEAINEEALSLYKV